MAGELNTYTLGVEMEGATAGLLYIEKNGKRITDWFWFNTEDKHNTIQMAIDRANEWIEKRLRTEELIRATLEVNDGQ